MKSFNSQNEKQLYLTFTPGGPPDDTFHPLLQIQSSEVISRRFIKSEELFYTAEFSVRKMMPRDIYLCDLSEHSPAGSKCGLGRKQQRQ